MEKSMRNRTAAVIAFLLVFPLADKTGAESVMQLSKNVLLIPGPVNGVRIEKDNANLVIYGDPAGKIDNA